MKNINKNTIFILLLMISFCSESANLYFIPLKTGYTVYGSINVNDLTWVDRASSWAPFYVSVHAESNDFYTLSSQQPCSADINTAVKMINDQLTSGIVANRYQNYSDDGIYWSVYLACQTTLNPQDGGWILQTRVPSPPTSAHCETIVPLNIDFGEVILGKVGDVINADIKITCDRSVNIKMSMQGNTTGNLAIGDATVSYAFPGPATSYQLKALPDTPANFAIAFTTVDTGKTLGEKTGSTVLLMEWK